MLFQKTFTTSIPTQWFNNNKNNNLKNKVCFINAKDFVLQQKSSGEKRKSSLIMILK